MWQKNAPVITFVANVLVTSDSAAFLYAPKICTVAKAAHKLLVKLAQGIYAAGSCEVPP